MSPRAEVPQPAPVEPLRGIHGSGRAPPPLPAPRSPPQPSLGHPTRRAEYLPFGGGFPRSTPVPPGPPAGAPGSWVRARSCGWRGPEPTAPTMVAILPEASPAAAPEEDRRERPSGPVSCGAVDRAGREQQVNVLFPPCLRRPRQQQHGHVPPPRPPPSPSTLSLRPDWALGAGSLMSPARKQKGTRRPPAHNGLADGSGRAGAHANTRLRNADHATQVTARPAESRGGGSRPRYRHGAGRGSGVLRSLHSSPKPRGDFPPSATPTPGTDTGFPSAPPDLI